MLLIKAISNLFKTSNKREEKKPKTSKSNTYVDQNEKIKIEEENKKDESFKKNSEIQEISDKKSKEIKSISSEKSEKENDKINKLGYDLKENLKIQEKEKLIVDDESDVQNSTNEDENQDSEHSEDLPCNDSKVGERRDARRNIVENGIENDDGDSESLSELLEKCTIVDKGPTRHRSKNHNNNISYPYPNQAQTSEWLGELPNSTYYQNYIDNNQQNEILEYVNTNSQPASLVNFDDCNSNNVKNLQQNHSALSQQNQIQQITNETRSLTVNDNDIYDTLEKALQSLDKTYPSWEDDLFSNIDLNILNSNSPQAPTLPVFPNLHNNNATILPPPSQEEAVIMNYGQINSSTTQTLYHNSTIISVGPPASAQEANITYYLPMNAYDLTSLVSPSFHNHYTTIMSEEHSILTPEPDVPLDSLQLTSSTTQTLQASPGTHNNNSTITSDEHPIPTPKPDVPLNSLQLTSSTTQTLPASPGTHKNNTTIMPEEHRTPTQQVVDVILDFCKQIYRQDQLNEVQRPYVPKNILYKTARYYCKRRLSPNYKHDDIAFKNLQNLMKKTRYDENEKLELNRVLKRIKNFFEATYVFWDEHLFEQRDRNNFNLLERILSEQSNCYLIEFYVVFNKLWKLGYPTSIRILNNAEYITSFLENCDNEGQREFIQTLLDTAQSTTIIQ